MLPDDVLVEIFYFYASSLYSPWRGGWLNAWHTLVHVCRRWRCVVLGSPRHLNLRLEYKGHRPMSEELEAWSVLPVTLISRSASDQHWENIVAALESEHYNRICEIYTFYMTDSRLERFAAAMQKPFLELTHLFVSGYVVPVLPNSFLGGSAPRLRDLRFNGIPFPSILKLLLSANGLVTLTLEDIPDSGYFPPDAMATALTVMTRLEYLCLEFRSPQSLPDPASGQPPPMRFVLPAFKELTFQGVHEYLEDLLARIDAPLLYVLHITFFMDLDFDVPEVHRLIDHTEEFKTFEDSKVVIYDHFIQLSFYPKASEGDHCALFDLRIRCKEVDRQLSSLAQFCSPPFSLLSALEELEIKELNVLSSSNYLSFSRWKAEMENTQCLLLLHPFTALKDLYRTDTIALCVCSDLVELPGEMATEVLPALRNLFVQGSSLFEDIQEAIKPFVAARQLSGHPVVIRRR